MPRRFTGIRLLLVFVGINLLMFLTLVTSMTGAHPWIAHILPGHFESGTDSSGYWVFFALVLLVDAVTVFIAGLAVMLPAMIDGAPLAERRLTRLFVDRAGMSEEAKEAIFVGLREDAVNAHVQLIVGRSILLAGAIFLAAAFFAVTLSFVKALPGEQMFILPRTTIVIDDGKTKTAETNDLTLRNYGVETRDIVMFAADQTLASATLNAPDIYGFHFSNLAHNQGSRLFTHFVFAFRTIFGFALVLIVVSFLRRPQRPVRQKKTIASVEAKLEEKK